MKGKKKKLTSHFFDRLHSTVNHLSLSPAFAPSVLCCRPSHPFLIPQNTLLYTIYIMSKRAQDQDEDMREAKSAFNVGDRTTVDDEGMGEFEDPWEDEVESDQEVIIDNGADDDEGKRS